MEHQIQHEMEVETRTSSTRKKNQLHIMGPVCRSLHLLKLGKCHRKSESVATLSFFISAAISEPNIWVHLICELSVWSTFFLNWIYAAARQITMCGAFWTHVSMMHVYLSMSLIYLSIYLSIYDAYMSESLWSWFLAVCSHSSWIFDLVVSEILCSLWCCRFQWQELHCKFSSSQGQFEH